MKKRTVFTLVAVTMTFTVGSSTRRTVMPPQVKITPLSQQDTVVKNMHKLEVLLTVLDEKL